MVKTPTLSLPRVPSLIGGDYDPTSCTAKKPPNKQTVNQPVTRVQSKGTDFAREDSLPVCGFKRFSFRRDREGDDIHSPVSGFHFMRNTFLIRTVAATADLCSGCLSARHFSKGLNILWLM